MGPKLQPINCFAGDYEFLSNFHASPLEYEGEVYPTVEHAFQAAKSLDVAERARIRAAETPGKAKRLGRKVKLREDWENVKVDIMDDLLCLKFSDPILRDKLNDTGDAELIEGNNWGDTFWGMDSKKWEGQNILGKLLMRVRNNIRINMISL
jgi:hypothetical protein